MDTPHTKITSPVFHPAGRCIYCGTTDGTLSDEHIIAFALNGELVLPKSSCASCAKITGAKIEQAVLKQTFPDLRSRYRLRSRRPKGRPTHFTFRIGNRELSLPIAELPYLSWAMPTFDFPGLSLNRLPSDPGKRSIQCQVGLADAERLLAKGSGTEAADMTLGKIDAAMFQRMIAKIAHSFACAHAPDGFTPILSDLIMKGSDNPSYLVGCDNPQPPADDTLWSLKFGTLQPQLGPIYYAVQIRLFGFLGTPSYVVMVGRPRGAPVEKVNYTKTIEIKIVDR